MLIAQRPAASLLLAAIVVALTFNLNRGCALDPLALCPSGPMAQFSVLMNQGQFGFLPTFLLTALAAILGFDALTQLVPAGLLQKGISSLGRNSLGLLIINGAVYAIIEPWLGHAFAQIPMGWVFFTLCALQLLASQLLAGFFAQLMAAATRAAQYCVDFGLKRIRKAKHSPD